MALQTTESKGSNKSRGGEVPKTLEEIAEKMRKIDICMMTTVLDNGQLASRPMSNNGDVDYDGHSYFFSSDKQDLVRELERNPNVNLAFTGDKKLLGGGQAYVSVVGRAELIRDKAQMQKHWTKDLELWFEDGLDTPGLVMIHVAGKRVKIWENWESGEVVLS